MSCSGIEALLGNDFLQHTHAHVGQLVADAGYGCRDVRLLSVVGSLVTFEDYSEAQLTAEGLGKDLASTVGWGCCAFRDAEGPRSGQLLFGFADIKDRLPKVCVLMAVAEAFEPESDQVVGYLPFAAAYSLVNSE